MAEEKRMPISKTRQDTERTSCVSKASVGAGKSSWSVWWLVLLQNCLETGQARADGAGQWNRSDRSLHSFS